MANKKSSKKNDQIDLNQFQQTLSQKDQKELVNTLKIRFEENMDRHQGVIWTDVEEKLLENPDKLQSLYAMEITGGEPDVVFQDREKEIYTYYDCSAESPKGRRSICYDGKGQQERETKGVYPAGNAIDIATAMGIEILTEDQYRELQNHGNFDIKTSSWIKTPPDIRELGGAIFADYRYDHVFVYHNSAKSFYSARGFRGSLTI